MVRLTESRRKEFRKEARNRNLKKKSLHSLHSSNENSEYKQKVVEILDFNKSIALAIFYTRLHVQLTRPPLFRAEPELS